MKKVKGIGKWEGKDVPGMYQDGGAIFETPVGPPKKDDKDKIKIDIKDFAPNPRDTTKTTNVDKKGIFEALGKTKGKAKK